MSRNNFLERFKERMQIAKFAKDALHKKIYPEHFVEQELKQFEKYTETQKEYRQIAESFLEEERNKRLDRIIEGFQSIRKTDLRAKEYHRIVKSKFSADPLCAMGSVEKPPGGRFNFGKSTRFVTDYFYALYIANSYETAFEESFHSMADSIGDFASVKINVSLDSYLDLTDDKTFQVFYDAIKDIKLPSEFETLARKMGVAPLTLAESPTALKTAILLPTYKAWDTWLDRFAPSQWFGEYARKAEIGGLLYPSVRNDGGINLAIFMDNFEGTRSEVELCNPEAWPTIPDKRKKINSDNYLEFHKPIKKRQALM